MYSLHISVEGKFSPPVNNPLIEIQTWKLAHIKIYHIISCLKSFSVISTFMYESDQTMFYFLKLKYTPENWHSTYWNIHMKIGIVCIQCAKLFSKNLKTYLKAKINLFLYVRCKKQEKWKKYFNLTINFFHFQNMFDILWQRPFLFSFNSKTSK